MTTDTVIGIDLGGTKVAGALFNRDSMISPKVVQMVENRTRGEVGALVLEVISRLMQWGEERGLAVSDVGIAVPGIYHSLTRTVWAPNIPGWEDYPLYQELQEELHPAAVGIRIDSDRACCIMGEAWRGVARGCRDAIFLAVGTGIGAGIMVDGNILRGSHDIAGAVGWMALTHPWFEGYKSCGCFEYHASGNGMAERARELLRSEHATLCGAKGSDPEQVTAADIFEAFSKEDPYAEEIVNRCIEFWGKASANLVSIFNPEKIIFGGGVFGPAVQFLDDIYEEARKWAQPVSIGKVKFEASGCGQDAGLFGAAFLALNNDREI